MVADMAGKLRGTFAVLALLLLIADMSGSLQAAPPVNLPSSIASPSPSPSPSLTEAELLALPSHDVEIFRAPEALRVGDSLVLKIPGISPGEVTLDPLPELQEQGWLLTSLSKQEENQKEFRFEAAPLKPGTLILPSLPLRDQAGKAFARTNPFSLQIASSIKPEDQKPSEPAPLRPPLLLNFPVWVAFAGVLLLIALVVGAIFAFRKLRKKQLTPARVAPIKPVLPEDEEALAALKALETGGPLSRGHFKAHYFGLSEILKAYLGRRYRFDALESTSREILLALEKRQRLSEAALDRLEILFEKLDLVKFTDHIPIPSEGIDLLREARELVLTTRRPPAPAPILEPRLNSKENT
ncbi:MAG: hypothetical protein A2Z97_11065 [Bdellovibrionales bacterium GWB1_52_6]|nr:MAG: hypothetical protein A2Z97_11065 [Bdellovibrionales bacterium GWB1_52_6]OFZ02555.1 MAG: hypothetical protein A2X97_07810 [Bdellovibrionales bacterium GWA1_52_35]HCM41405.1 hypothetical protein [Bdellovibrionales bacterium]